MSIHSRTLKVQEEGSSKAVVFIYCSRCNTALTVPHMWTVNILDVVNLREGITVQQIEGNM